MPVQETTWCSKDRTTSSSVADRSANRISKKLDEEDEADEVEVKLADCPEPVRKTLTREADGAKIDKVDKFSKEGRWLFETDVKIDGKNYEIIVTEQGLLLSKRVDEEDEEDEKEEKKGEKEDK